MALLGPGTGGLQASRILKGEAWSASQAGSGWLLPLFLPGTCPLQGALQPLPGARRPLDPAWCEETPRPCPSHGIA